MVREQESGVSTLSVVPLLQERFRQLQRMKELREEKELLRMLSESAERAYHSAPHTSHNYELLSKKCSSSQLMFLPPKPHCQLSLSLWPHSSPTNHANPPGTVEAPPKSWLTDAPLLSTFPLELDLSSASDVDTSLRL